MQKRPRKELHAGRFGSRQRFSLSPQRFLALCRDRGFPGRDRVVFLLFLWHNNVLFFVMTMSRQRFPYRH